MSTGTEARIYAQNISYADLERQFGEVAALSLLMEMEVHVGLSSSLLAGVEPEARLQVVLALMNGLTGPGSDEAQVAYA